MPCVEISDSPRFGYRGLHLDVSRHMFPVEFIKKYVDLMASYKLNQFHWHLTDDQGWRIEIKKYPKLQEVAAYRDETVIGHKKKLPNLFDAKRYGGYTTLKTVYNYEPIPEVLTQKEKAYIIGTPANVWTEYIQTPEQVEYMTYPRALALAERSWSPATRRDFTDFTMRLKGNLHHLRAQGVKYAAHAIEE